MQQCSRVDVGMMLGHLAFGIVGAAVAEADSDGNSGGDAVAATGLVLFIVTAWAAWREAFSDSWLTKGLSGPLFGWLVAYLIIRVDMPIPASRIAGTYLMLFLAFAVAWTYRTYRIAWRLAAWAHAGRKIRVD